MPAFAPIRLRSPIADPLLAAAGERAHDGRPAADVRPVADHDALHDPALDHRGAQRAGVEVDEALVHHGRAGGQVGAEAHPVGVGDPHPGGHDVVGHPRELVDAVHGQVAAGGALEQAQLVDPVRRARAGRGPGDVGQRAEDAVEVERVGPRPGGARAGAAAGTRRRRRRSARPATRSSTRTSTVDRPGSARGPVSPAGSAGGVGRLVAEAEEAGPDTRCRGPGRRR